MISKIVGDLSSRFPDYAISPRTREEKKKKKIRKEKRKRKKNGFGMELLWRYRNATLYTLDSVLLSTYMYMYIYIWLDTWRAYDHENGLL